MTDADSRPFVGDDSRPFVGDYVGLHNETGAELYICAVDYVRRLVRIGEFDGAGQSEWLNETQARAFYNYEWGRHSPIPADA